MSDTGKLAEAADSGLLQPRLVSLCESCRFMQADFPTMEDPLACPFCAKGHWSGYIVDAPPEEDPWKDCSDFQANTKLGN